MNFSKLVFNWTIKMFVSQGLYRLSPSCVLLFGVKVIVVLVVSWWAQTHLNSPLIGETAFFSALFTVHSLITPLIFPTFLLWVVLYNDAMSCQVLDQICEEDWTVQKLFIMDSTRTHFKVNSRFNCPSTSCFAFCLRCSFIFCFLRRPWTMFLVL